MNIKRSCNKFFDNKIRIIDSMDKKGKYEGKIKRNRKFCG